MNVVYLRKSLEGRETIPVVASILIAGGLAILAGCASEPETHVVSAPPPNVVVPVTTAPAQVVVAQAPGQTGAVILNQAPPAGPQVVVTPPARPASDYVWVDAHWTYRNERYEWVNGAWERPPVAGAYWIPPRSERQSNGNYLFYEGHWSDN